MHIQPLLVIVGDMNAGLIKYAPYLLAFFAFCLYLFTAAPFTLWLDASRFVAAIYELGIANPPEPLYVLLAHPFIYLPIGTIIFRIQIFSALTAGIALLFLYSLAVKFIGLIGEEKKSNLSNWINLAALFSTALLAFSYQFWSQAQNVENFILVTLIEIVILLLLVTANTKKKFFINFSLIALVFGLATGTNPVIASVIPAIVWTMWQKKSFITVPWFIAWVVIGTIAVIGIHLYMPWRAVENPFLNYWRATNFENTWKLSTGAGLNVYVPEIGRINGFTMSPEIFLKSTWYYVEMFLLKFTPLLVPFIIFGGYYLWKKEKNWFIFLHSIIGANWLFSALYFSGNQESWFLMSDVVFVLLAGIGYWWLVNGFAKTALAFIHAPLNYSRYVNLLFFVVFVPLVVWFPFLNRREWVVTEDYINNLYRPMGNDKAILFGSSDLYDSVSFYVHDVPGTSVYRPNVIPITDNLFYILRWYRENLMLTTDLKIPDDSKLKYDLADEYSRYVNDFFAMNIDRYKIFISVPAIRNNFLYAGADLGSSFKFDELRFKLVPQGMLYQVVPKEAKVESNPANFEYLFTNSKFPMRKPFFLEQSYKAEMTGVLNEYAYSLEGVGDAMLKQGKSDEAFKYYQKAYEFNPRNAEVVSRLGNYYGMTGDHKKASEYFEKALKLEPGNTGLLFNVAVAYENTGRIDKAISSLNRVIQYSKPNSQIAQLARTRLQFFNSQASGSAQFGATSSALPGEQILPELQVPIQKDNAKTFQDASMNLSFAYPEGYVLRRENKNVVVLTNNLSGNDELTITFVIKTLKSESGLAEVEETLPFKVGGSELITQPVALPGFEAIGKTYGTGEHLTFILYMRKGKTGIIVRIYPGDSTKVNDFNKILQSISTVTP